MQLRANQRKQFVRSTRPASHNQVNMSFGCDWLVGQCDVEQYSETLFKGHLGNSSLTEPSAEICTAPGF